MLAKLRPYLINEQGQLKEWAVPDKGENNSHRHLMHLYGAFQSQELSEEADPTLFEAARVAPRNRLSASTETATHGRLHMGLAAAELGVANELFAVSRSGQRRPADSLRRRQRRHPGDRQPDDRLVQDRPSRGSGPMMPEVGLRTKLPADFAQQSGGDD